MNCEHELRVKRNVFYGVTKFRGDNKIVIWCFIPSLCKICEVRTVVRL